MLSGREEALGQPAVPRNVCDDDSAGVWAYTHPRFGSLGFLRHPLGFASLSQSDDKNNEAVGDDGADRRDSKHFYSVPGPVFERFEDNNLLFFITTL